MKSIQFLVFIFVLISVKSFTPNPVSYSVYYSPDKLIQYFQNNYEYWTQHSVFFQFDSYLSKNEIENILSIMNDIYEKHNLYGIFLVFDKRVGINDISYYAASIAWNLHYYMGYNRDRTYIITIEYTVGDYGSQWENELSIFKGGSSFGIYLSDDGIKNLINEYSSSLKYYNFNNVLKFINGVKSSMDNSKNNYNKNNIKTSSFDGKTFLGILLIILFCCCCRGYCCKKQRDRESQALTYKEPEPINETQIVENSIVNVKATKIVAYREHYEYDENGDYAKYAEYAEYAEYSEY